MPNQRGRIATCAAACYVMFSGDYLLNAKKKKKKRWWMMSLYKSRARFNATDMLHEFIKEPSGQFNNFCRMTAADFEYLLNKIGPHIAKNDTNMRKCIPVQERFAVALRFLATGDSYASLSFLFKFSTQTVSKCVDEVCSALIHELQELIKLPETPNEWLDISKEYEIQWNFPHCLGALDGKHIVIQCPAHSGSEFYNYKGTFSLVLLALVDANYCFTFVDIGCQGRISDGGVFRNSSLFAKLDENLLNLPSNNPLPLQKEDIPYVFVADDAFALSVNMMKPYSGVHEKGSKERIFNYRLSRARRIVENVFGIMSAIFRVLRKPILLSPDKVTNVVMTCVLLHNFLRKSKSSRSLYTPINTFDREEGGEFQPGSWRNDQNGLTSLMPLRKTARKPGGEAKTVRDAFAQYFTTCGSIPWQDKY